MIAQYLTNHAVGVSMLSRYVASRKVQTQMYQTLLLYTVYAV